MFKPRSDFSIVLNIPGRSLRLPLVVQEARVVQAVVSVMGRDVPADRTRRIRLAGSGLDVWEVITTLRQNRNSLEATARYLELPVARLRPAVRYYAAFPEEIDDRIAMNEEVARSAQEAARRERAVLE